MAKFCGTIGYVETVKTSPGIYTERVTERESTGDLVRNYGKHENSGNVNDNINISNSISIVADPYATEHFFAMRYVKFGLPNIGGVWKIESAEINYPRISLSIGGVYDGYSTPTSE